MLNYRVGTGYDVHRLVENRELIVGGVKVPHNKGLDGHSDADVLIHAIMDSILGALGKGDIGVHFPDTSNKFKGIASTVLLNEVYIVMENEGFEINNIDATIIAQEPKFAKYINSMSEVIAKVLHTESKNVNIKATTEEKLGFTGRKEGISAQAICMLKSKK